MIALDFVGFAIAFAISLVGILLLEQPSRRLGLVDKPGGRKDHLHATPVTGGVAITIGALLPLLWLVNIDPAIQGLLVAGAIVMVVGALDDVYDIPWQLRLVAQVVAALLMSWTGDVHVDHVGLALGLENLVMPWISTPLTVVATVGLINALNMIDGVDGLAGSQVLASFIMLAAAAIYSGNYELLTVILVFAGAVSGYLALNFRAPWGRNAKVFLGNSGSALLGLVIAWVSFRMTQDARHPVTPVLAPFLVAIPVIDCLVLIFRRTLKGRSPFDAARDHVHHLMLAAGMSKTALVATLFITSLMIGLAAAAARLLGLPTPAFPIIMILMMIGYFAFSWKDSVAIAFFARFVRRREKSAPEQPSPPEQP